MKFDKAFEEDILARALKDVVYLRKATRILDAHHFNSPQHAWIWACIRDTWSTYRELTNPRLMMSRAKVDFPKDDDRVPYLELTSKLYKRRPMSSDAALDELSTFVKTINAQLAMEEAAVALEKGKIENTYEALKQLIRRDVNQRDYTVINWIEEFKKRQRERKLRKEHPELFTVIPTGWKRIDSIITGIEVGELGLLMATTGQGKSIGLNNLIQTAVARKYPAVYFPLEMPARQVAMRQDTRWLGYSYRKFKHYEWKPSELRSIEARLRKVEKEWSNMFKIVSMPLRKCNIDTLVSALEDLEQEYDFKPKMIIVDSGDHMKPVGKGENHRLDQAEVYWSLKSLAEEGGYAVWSSCQAGREYAKTIATAEAASESYDKARIADIVLSINTPGKKTRSTKIAIDEDGEEIGAGEAAPTAAENRAELYLAKYRDGRSRVTIPLNCEFDVMLIEEMEVS